MKPSERIQEIVKIECVLPNREATPWDFIEAVMKYLDEQAALKKGKG